MSRPDPKSRRLERTAARSEDGFVLPGFAPINDAQPRIGIVGDVVIDRIGSSSLKAVNQPWGFLTDLIRGLDLFIVTFDGTLDGSDPKSGGIRVISDEGAIDSIPKGRQTLFNLANNHAFDSGIGGFTRMCRSLRERGIAWVGAGESRPEAESPWVTSIAGRRLKVFAAVHHGCHPRPSTKEGGQVALLDSASWWQNVSSASEDGSTVIVLLHGGVQGSHYPSPSAIEMSRRLASCRVSAVVWSHAHAVQGIEKNDSTLLAYGLGNAFYLPLDGDPLAPNPTPAYDEGLFITFAPSDKGILGAEGYLFERIGERLRPVPALARRVKWIARISEGIGSRHYEIFWRLRRVWEDVIVGIWMYLRRGRFHKRLLAIRPRHLRKLAKKLMNARADAIDV